MHIFISVREPRYGMTMALYVFEVTVEASKGSVLVFSVKGRLGDLSLWSSVE